MEYAPPAGEPRNGFRSVFSFRDPDAEGDIGISGAFTPVLAKHSKSFNLIDALAVGVDRIQRNFEPLQRQVELWRKTQITDDTAKLTFYSAFIDGTYGCFALPFSASAVRLLFPRSSSITGSITGVALNPFPSARFIVHLHYGLP